MDWKEQCRKVHREGLDARAKMPYENARIPFRLRPYGESGRYANELIFEEGIDDLRRMLLRKMALPLFRKFNVAAVLIQSDARMAKMPEIISHFGWPEDLSYQEYADRYSQVLSEQFDGTTANLPRGLWTDAIFTIVKGPRTISFGMSTAYAAGERNNVVYGATTECPGMISEILPDWWESTVN